MLNSGKMSPEQISAIKLAEIDFQKFLKSNEIKLAELDQQDRGSARSMAIATHSVTPSVLTWIIVLLTLLAEGALLFNQIPPGADPIIIGRVLGTMDAALMLVLTFWFGSNSSSARKTELLASSTPGQK